MRANTISLIGPTDSCRERRWLWPSSRLGKAFVVGHMGLQHLGDPAENPVDLLVLSLLVGRFSTRRFRGVDLNWRWRWLDGHTAKPNANRSEQQKLQERRFAREQ
jgi:hypothetical protein